MRFSVTTFVRITNNPNIYKFSRTLTDNAGLVPMSANNTFYAPDAHVYVLCDGVELSLEKYQEMGYNVDSVLKDLPSNE